MMKKNILLALSVVALSSPVFAKQSLQAAMVKNPKIADLVAAVKAVSGVDCYVVDTLQSVNIYGPESKQAVTQQAPCFDPDAFNPTQLGQLTVTYYGSGETDKSEVGAVVKINYEVFK